MFNAENGKKLIKLGYLVNTGVACLNFLIILLASFDVTNEILIIFSALVNLAALAGAAATIGGFALVWYFERNMIYLLVPAVFVATFVLGFVGGYANAVYPSSYISIVSVLISLVSLGEYAAWVLIIKNKNRLFALGLLAVCGFGFMTNILSFTLHGSEIITVINSMVSCAGMGLCFLSSLQMD